MMRCAQRGARSRFRTAPGGRSGDAGRLWYRSYRKPFRCALFREALISRIFGKKKDGAAQVFLELAADGSRGVKMRRWMVLCLGLSACAEAPYGESISYNARNPNPIDVVMPTDAPSITQQFRPAQDTVFDGATTDAHVGLDVHAPRGTPVLAAAPGRVRRAFFDPAYGHTLELDHGADESGLRVVTRYLHLSNRDVVAGDRVARGRQIGQLGASGVLSGGFLHLHFEVIRARPEGGSEAMDPHLFWVEGVGRVTCFEPGRKIPLSPFRTTYPVVCRGG